MKIEDCAISDFFDIKMYQIRHRMEMTEMKD